MKILRNVMITYRDPEVVRSLKAFFESEGLHTHVCLTFDEYTSQDFPKIDVIILDITNATSTLFHEIEMARQLTPDTSFIVTSAHPDTANIIAALRAGAEDYLIEPFSQRELLSRVRKVLKKHDDD